MIHTAFHRQHNKVAAELSRLNPSWNDEQIFQEARRFVVAQYEHIVYEEWLPIIIGKKFKTIKSLNIFFFFKLYKKINLSKK